MSPRVLVIGASGSVGSATVLSSLSHGFPTIAFLRTPSKLPPSISNFPSTSLLTIHKGDALSLPALISAFKEHGKVDAVVVAAPMGDMRGCRSGYEEIAKNVVEAVKKEQEERGERIKVWFMAGSAVMEHPEVQGRYLSSFFPGTFYPEYPATISHLEKEAKEIDWSMLCPASIKVGEPTGPLVSSTTTPPLFLPRGFLTRYLLPSSLGLLINTMSYWLTTSVTFKSLGEFMIDNLQVGTDMSGKRVQVIENPKG
ncbi:hypothetical protein T439DRAFT_355989 [Meredithblackwellia eburnea MCA 4105]